MAGAGFKTFAVGEVLTANNVNTYLMQQAVMVFADAAARTTALPAPSEGMVSYLADTDQLEKYTGAAWVDITADSIAKGLIDAKGDLIVGTADNTPARLGVGTNGQVLTADSGAATGLAWASAGSSGKVLQVVQATAATEALTTSSTYGDIGLSVTITPSAATSKVLVFFYVISSGYSASGNIVGGGTRLLRGSTVILAPSSTTNHSLYMKADTNPVTDYQITAPVTAVYLDDPNTTSATTYKLQHRATDATYASMTANATGVIVAIEIGA
jgi:hypothetical protein